MVIDSQPYIDAADGDVTPRAVVLNSKERRVPLADPSPEGRGQAPRWRPREGPRREPYGRLTRLRQ